MLFVQLVHYPLFLSIGSEFFVAYELKHTTRTGWIVAPLMLLEAAGSTILLFLDRTSPSLWIAWILLFVVWLSTFLIQVPIHRELCQSFREEKVQKLVKTNWYRTIAWTGRGILLLIYVFIH